MLKAIASVGWEFAKWVFQPVAESATQVITSGCERMNRQWVQIVPVVAKQVDETITAVTDQLAQAVLNIHEEWGQLLGGVMIVEVGLYNAASLSDHWTLKIITYALAWEFTKQVFQPVAESATQVITSGCERMNRQWVQIVPVVAKQVDETIAAVTDRLAQAALNIHGEWVRLLGGVIIAEVGLYNAASLSDHWALKTITYTLAVTTALIGIVSLWKERFPLPPIAPQVRPIPLLQGFNLVNHANKRDNESAVPANISDSRRLLSQEVFQARPLSDLNYEIDGFDEKPIGRIQKLSANYEKQT